MEITFIIPGHITPWGRPRFTSKARTKQKGFFKDPKVGRYQADIQALARIAGLKKIAEGPVSIMIVARYKPPIRPENGRDCSPGAPYLNTPDVDNIEKVVLDALNRVAFTDDRQVSSIATVKIYGLEDSMTVKIYDRHLTL